MTDKVLIAVDKAVMTITLNRPEKKNALTLAMYGAVAEAIRRADADPQVRCVLIQAEGDMFTAGNDLSEFAAVGAAEAPTNAEREPWVGNPLLVALANAKVPLVAAVHGRAVGVGVTMLLHCDLVYVAEEAKLSTPFVNLALVPEAASSLLLPARIGHVRAFALFALGEVIDGQTAVQYGIANAALPADQVRAKARAAAEAVAALPPRAAAATKALMRDAERMLAVMEREDGHFADQLRSPEAKEAFAAFAEKRPADFSKIA